MHPLRVLEQTVTSALQDLAEEGKWGPNYSGLFNFLVACFLFFLFFFGASLVKSKAF